MSILNVRPEELINELGRQGFAVNKTGATHYTVYGKDGDKTMVTIAMTHARGSKTFFTDKNWSILKNLGFTWPPPPRETEKAVQPEIKVVESGLVPGDSSRVGSSVPEPDQMMLVGVHKLKVDMRYQREPKDTNPAIARPWSASKAGVIYVSERANGDMYVLDGWHRVQGAKRADWPRLPALVYRGLTVAQEAELFYTMDHDRTGINAMQQFKARLTSKDPIATALVKQVEECGFKVPSSNMTSYPYIMAVQPLEQLYRWGVLGRTLTAIRHAWPDDHTTTKHPTLLGVGAILHVYAGEVEAKRLQATMDSLPHDKLMREAMTLQYAQGGSMWSWVARVLVKHYNKRLATRRLPAFTPPRLPKTGRG